MTDQTIETLAAPDTAAGEPVAPAAAQVLAPMPTPAPAVITLTPEQFAELLAAAKSGRQPAPAAVAEADVERIAVSDAAKPGSVVLHKGRPALVLAVHTRDRKAGSKVWQQVSYELGVFAEHRHADAEDVGTP